MLAAAILGFLRPYALKLALAGAATLAVLAFLGFIRNQGRHIERAAQLNATLEEIQRAKQIENNLARTAGDPKQRLRQRWSNG